MKFWMALLCGVLCIACESTQLEPETEPRDSGVATERPDARIVRPPDAAPPPCMAESDYGHVDVFGRPVALSVGGTVNDPAVIMVAAILRDAEFPDILNVLLYRGSAPIAPGTYVIEGSALDPQSCPLCVFIETDRDFAADPPQPTHGRIYFTTGGTLELTSTLPRIAGTLRDVSFQHIWIDPETNSISPHSDGCQSHIVSLEFDTPVRRSEQSIHAPNSVIMEREPLTADFWRPVFDRTRSVPHSPLAQP